MCSPRVQLVSPATAAGGVGAGPRAEADAADAAAIIASAASGTKSSSGIGTPLSMVPLPIVEPKGPGCRFVKVWVVNIVHISPV